MLRATIGLAVAVCSLFALPAVAQAPAELTLTRIDCGTGATPTDVGQRFSDLLHYCDYSAAPVGRIVLSVAGAATERNVADSDAVCNALQVLEHCQDVGEDARDGRVYIPGVELSDALAATTGSAVREAVATHVALARGMLQAGRPLVRRLSGWPRLAVADLVAVASLFGISSGATRTCLWRMAANGELTSTDGTYALASHLLERRRRWEGLVATITARDPGDWIDDQLADIRKKHDAGARAQA